MGMTAQDGSIFIGQAVGGSPSRLRLDRANRHGLVAGATGTGKTVTLQGLAEGFSRAGVPVFAADVKGEDMKTHKLVNWSKCKDYFRKTKDGWKCYMVEEIKDETTLDGKPFPMMMGKAK